MFSSNITLKATLQAEKEKEKEENRLAARYLKIRALLDDAEDSINGANITRKLKNTLLSKITKARRALDKGLDVEKVVDMMVMVISIINSEIRQDKLAMNETTKEMKNDMDSFYKYDYNKYLASEMPWISSASPKNEDKSFESTSIDDSMHVESKDDESQIKEENATLLDDQPHFTDSSTQTTEDLFSSQLTNETSASDLIMPNFLKKSISEKEEEDLLTKTIETLSSTLHLLRELPKMHLNPTQHSLLVTTIKTLKPILANPEGCLALSEPLRELVSVVEVGKGVLPPREPDFTNCLLAVRTVASQFIR